MKKKSIREEVREKWQKIENDIKEEQRQIKEQYKNKAEELGQEKRQEVLIMIKSGKTLGEVGKHFNIDTMVVCEILTQNIQHASYLRSEAV